MPPRGKKKAAAKKITPKSKPAVETPKISSPIEEKNDVIEAETSISVEIKQEEQQEIVVSKDSEVEKNQDTVFMEEEGSLSTSVTTVTVTTVVVEESEVVEETRSEIDHKADSASVAVEESRLTTEEIVEEERLEIEVPSAAGDVAMNEHVEEPVEEEEEEEEEKEENGVSEGNESEPEEDGIQDLVEGGQTAAEVTVAGEDSDGEEDESGSDDEDDEDLSSYMQIGPYKEKKKQTGVEIFVGGLNRKAVEEDLTKVFGEFGEIKSVRIVKNPVTKRSKGYAFITYATVEQAQKVLTELKDGIEVAGKRAGVSPSQDSDTLYMGNICKTWTKEQVLETLKTFGIELTDDIYLPEDPKSEGKIRGFAYLEFNNHSDAMAAFQRLRKPDAVFGRNISAKVAFAPSMHPSEEALSKVKTVYVEGLTDSWDEEKLKKLCVHYGELEKVQLSRDLVSVKRKDFGFISFTSRENALACVAGINNAQIGEGDIKIKANIAKPQYKGRLGKNARGGYKVQKDAEKTKEPGKSNAKGGSKSKGDKGKSPLQSKSSGGVKRSQGSIAERQGATAASREKVLPANGRKRDGRNTNSGPSGRPSKKPRGDARGGRINNSGNRGRSFHSGRGRQPHIYDRAPAVYADPYARGYIAPESSYRGRAYGAGSEMAPHAGYLRPAPMSQGRDPYEYGIGRTGGYDMQGSGAPSYVGGPMPPPSYAPGYSQYASYESRNGGGYVYPSNGTYVPRRSYY